MIRQEFTTTLNRMVQKYIENFTMYDSNPQLRVNPATLEMTIINGRDMMLELAENDEVVEAAAGAERPDEKDADDMQVRQNPDFYAVKTQLLEIHKGEEPTPSARGIADIADVYFKD